MKKRIIIILLFNLFLIPFISFAQVKVIGKVFSKDSKLPINSATVCLNLKKFTTSNNEGRFQFKNIKSDSISLKITYIGFQKYEANFKLPKNKKKLYLPDIFLKTDNIEIGEIKVQGEGVLERIKGDTTEYNVGLLKMDKYASARELVEALPGISRNGKGDLLAKGKKVRIVTINGKYLYRDKVDENLDALPADLIAKVQIYDDYSELAKFCGFDSEYSDQKAINIITKYKNLKMALGQYNLGGGLDNKYILQGNNTFLLGNSNMNIKEGMSNLKDHLNMIGMDFNEFKSPDFRNKNIQSAYAIQNNKINIYVDGKYDNSFDANQSKSEKQHINEDRINKSLSNYNSYNQKGEFKFNMDLSINKKNKIYFSSGYSNDEYENEIKHSTNQYLNSEEILTSNSTTFSKNKSMSLKNNIVSRSLLSPTAYLEMLFLSGYRNSENSSHSKGTINNTLLNKRHNTENSSYIYQFKPKLVIRRNSDNINTFENSLIYQKSELINNANLYKHNYLINILTYKSKYSFNKVNFFYTLGFKSVKSVESLIKSEFYSPYIIMNSSFQLLKKYRLTFRLKSETSTPKLNQLYDIYNNENPLFVQLGNKDLKQSTQNDFTLDVNKMGCPFFFSLNYSLVNDNISNNSFYVKNGEYKGKQYTNGTQISSYKNVDGYWNSSVRIMYSKKIMSSLNYTYSNIPNYYNGVKNINKQNKITLTLNINDFRNKSYFFGYHITANYYNTKGTVSAIKSQYLRWQNHLVFGLRNFLKSNITVNYLNSYNYTKSTTSYDYMNHFLTFDIKRSILKKKIDLSIQYKALLNEDKAKLNYIRDEYVYKSEKNITNNYLLFSLHYKFQSVKSDVRNKFRNHYGFPSRF